MQCNNDDPGEHEQFDEELVGLCNPVVPKADSIVGLSRNNQARYRLTNLLGRGGMGIVYRAEDLELQRTVAIKLVLPKRISRVGKRSVAEEILQLQKEARDAGKLQHTNIVHIYRFLILDKNWREKILFDEGISLEEDPVACLVMQFIDGDRLVSFTDSPHREFIPSTEEFADTIAETVFDHGGLLEPSSAPARHSLSANHKESEDREGRDRQRIKKSYIRKMATIGECIADALEHAHHEGVRHNDVKPQNILVDRDGNAWLTDFGLAHSKLDPIVDSSSIVGTYAYLAPEAANGINDHRRDIFALGATLYRMLTFETVFTAQSAKEFREQAKQYSAPDVRKLNPAVPKDLAAIVTKAIAADPELRYKSSALLARDLNQFLEGRSVSARPRGFITHARKWAVGNPVAALMTSLVAAGLLFGSFLLSQYRVSSFNQTLSASIARWGVDPTMVSQRSEVEASLKALSETGFTIAPKDLVQLRSVAVENYSKLDLEPTTDPPASDVEFSKSRLTIRKDSLSDEIILCRRSDPRNPCRILPTGSELSRSGEWIYRLGEAEGQWRIELEKAIFGPTETTPIALDCKPQHLAFGKGLVAYSDYKRVIAVDIQTGKEVFTTRLIFPVKLLSFNEDDSRLFVASTEPDVGYVAGIVLETVEGEITQKHYFPSVSDHIGFGPAVAWNSNHSSVAYSLGDKVVLWDYGALNQATQFVQPGKDFNCISLSNDCDYLLTGEESGRGTIWNTTTGRAESKFIVEPWASFSKTEPTLFGVRKDGKPVACKLNAPFGFAESSGYRGPSVNNPTFVRFDDQDTLFSASLDGVNQWHIRDGFLEDPEYISRDSSTGIVVGNNGAVICRATGRVACFQRTVDDRKLSLSSMLPMDSDVVHRLMDSPSLSRDADVLVVPDAARDKALLFSSLYSENFEQRTIAIPDFRIDRASVSPDGKFVALGSSVQDGIYLYDIQQQKSIQNLPASGNVSFSPDGKQIVASTPTGYSCFHKPTGSNGWTKKFVVATSKSHPIKNVFCISRAGLWATAQEDGLIAIRDIDDGSVLFSLPQRGGTITSLDFNSDASMLAVGCKNHLVQLWDLTKLDQLFEKLNLESESNFAAPAKSNIGEYPTQLTAPLFTSVEDIVRPKVQIQLVENPEYTTGGMLEFEISDPTTHVMSFELYEGDGAKPRGLATFKPELVKNSTTRYRWKIPKFLEGGQRWHYLNGDKYWIKAIIRDRSPMKLTGFDFTEKPITIWAK